MRFFLTLLLSLLATTAQAQQLNQTFQNWSVFTHQGGCYIASAPTSSKGSFRSRGQPYLMVVHKTAALDEVNASSGYPYAEKTDAIVNLSGGQYKLFTQGKVAWAYDAAQDAHLVATMKQGTSLTLRGESPLKTWSEDTYSLNGFSDAYARMKTLCP